MHVSSYIIIGSLLSLALTVKATCNYDTSDANVNRCDGVSCLSNYQCQNNQCNNNVCYSVASGIGPWFVALISTVATFFLICLVIRLIIRCKQRRLAHYLHNEEQTLDGRRRSSKKQNTQAYGVAIPQQPVLYSAPLYSAAPVYGAPAYNTEYTAP